MISFAIDTKFCSFLLMKTINKDQKLLDFSIISYFKIFFNSPDFFHSTELDNFLHSFDEFLTTNLIN